MLVVLGIWRLKEERGEGEGEGGGIIEARCFVEQSGGCRCILAPGLPGSSECPVCGVRILARWTHQDAHTRRPKEMKAGEHVQARQSQGADRIQREQLVRKRVCQVSDDRH